MTRVNVGQGPYGLCYNTGQSGLSRVNTGQTGMAHVNAGQNAFAYVNTGFFIYDNPCLKTWNRSKSTLGDWTYVYGQHTNP